MQPTRHIKPPTNSDNLKDKFLVKLKEEEKGGRFKRLCWSPSEKEILIEGFRGKRALGFLLKSELCQKHSNFRMQFCLRVSNNVLLLFSLKFASFSRYYVCEKTH